jgi:hypothetical protein
MRPSEFERAHIIVEKVKQHPFWLQLCEKGFVTQKELYWTDRITNLPCKALVDIFPRLPATNNWLADLKTTADMDEFENEHYQMFRDEKVEDDGIVPVGVGAQVWVSRTNRRGIRGGAVDCDGAPGESILSAGCRDKGTVSRERRLRSQMKRFCSVKSSLIKRWSRLPIEWCEMILRNSAKREVVTLSVPDVGIQIVLIFWVNERGTVEWPNSNKKQTEKTKRARLRFELL